uniref:Uncharacterized protein n=1 Tax=Anopheles atroparvus TaxID=41427 RepID=A0A182IXH8_ANOAO
MGNSSSCGGDGPDTDSVGRLDSLGVGLTTIAVVPVALPPTVLPLLLVLLMVLLMELTAALPTMLLPVMALGAIVITLLGASAIGTPTVISVAVVPATTGTAPGVTVGTGGTGTVTCTGSLWHSTISIESCLSDFFRRALPLPAGTFVPVVLSSVSHSGYSEKRRWKGTRTRD